LNARAGPHNAATPRHAPQGLARAEYRPQRFALTADPTPAGLPSATAALLEREHELAALRETLAGAAAGRPGLVVIEGPAGIGKTRLLAAGRQVAAEAGLRVLAARGGALERGLAFGVVRQLFEVELIARADVLRGAAAPAREIFEATASAANDDASFAILHALYWLTVNLAVDGPLVLVVDDLHWCDEPSLRYLGYLVRRLEGSNLTVLCTFRPLERDARSVPLGDILGDPLTVALHPGPLSGDATERLVRESLHGEADEAFSTACWSATGGNPLLLGELLKTLHAEGVPPDAAHVSAVSDLGPRAVARAVLVRLARLPAAADRLAQAAAVLGDGAELPLVAALAGLEPDEAVAAAGALVGAEILSRRRAIAFVHPLVRAAVYEDILAHTRSLVHERAARLLRDRGAPARAIAVHLALAPARGDGWVAGVLEEAARGSLRAGSPAAATAWLGRALAEPPPAERRRDVLLALGRAETLTDGTVAAEHLNEALELTEDGAERASIALDLARTLLFTGRADESVAVIRRATAELGPEDDLRRALEAIELMAPLFGCGGTAAPAPFELTPGAGAGAKMRAAVAARQCGYAGFPADECTQLALGALEGGELIAADNVFLSVTAVLMLELADRPEAPAAWEALLQDTRHRGSLASKAAISLWRGYTLARSGELVDAEASLRAALEELRWNAAAEGGVHHAAFLSAVLRERGDLVGARRLLEAVDDPGDASDAARYWLDAMAELLLAEERFGEALAVAEDGDRRFAFLANPIDTPARSQRAIALYHLDRREEALTAAAEALELARRWGAPGTLARALRVLGTLERASGVERLRQAVEVAAPSRARLEHAKALAALGSALRAARRPSEARDPLRRALELADALDARAVAAYARRELHAAGARPRTAALTGPAALTPSERRVAERAAAGQTNRQIAEALFVTTKTVEMHLRNAYRKLGVRSRRELAGRLAGATASSR
jgi:DNA-binding CsgD family transcriptional regulator